MGRSNSSVGRLLVFLFLGLLFGGILGESLGLVLGKIGEATHAGFYNNIRAVFVNWWFDIGIGKSQPIVIDLYMVKFALGFAFRMNTASILGAGVALYMMKWSGGDR
ncbi:MAG TPA: DUF4321 domain-containing protein [Fibrobacteraceae bacterium]|nr:DUF4321 domain-containing protein [Fibrobacteraceae bacterium]